ncbi:TRAP transporter large permease subunit [Treponema primitia]|uniref:TRAP transporter large permease n=1 Tax=Treponema primitia TaxID=88058 RepID=UPI00397F90A5
MSAGLVALITILMLLVMIFWGIHLPSALMLTSVAGIFLSTGNINVAMNVLGSTSWGAIRDYVFGVIPLFTLMGLFANLSGASQELYDAASLILKKVRGGVGMATVLANAVFAAITGVSVASAAIFTKIAYPQMSRLGYDKKVAVGTIAGSAMLGMLIPPSLLMIVYGTQADESIGALFMGGIIPGIIMTIVFCITIQIIAIRRPGAIPNGQPLTEEEQKIFWKVVLKPWAIVVLIIISLGGIWAGLFTPTEAGGIGALGALILVFVKRQFKFKTFWETLLSAGTTTGSVLFLLISAQMYSRTMAISGIINLIERFVLGMNVPNMVIIGIFILIFVALGCILDSTSIILLTMPLMVPIVRSFGMNTVWFGITAIVAIETGLVTPPFGMNVFTVKAAAQGIKGVEPITVEDIFSGSVPFLLGIVFVVILMMAFPILVTYLPSLMTRALAQ